MTLRHLLAAPMLCATAAPAAAELRDEFQLWTSVAVSGDLGGGWSADGDVAFRYGDDFRYYQRLIRGTLAYDLSERVSLGAGYAHFLTTAEDGSTRYEHRPHQQLSISLGELLGGTVALRTRLETRLFESSDDVGFRLRQRVRYTRPLGSSLTGLVSAEPFFALDDTDFGARGGFDRLRTSGALRVRLSASANAELGYLNQWVSRRGRSDGMDHVLTMGLSFGF